MDEPRIRAAIASDIPVIRQIVEQAYRQYIARLGKPPGPMLDDYSARVSEGGLGDRRGVRNSRYHRPAA
jgi:hypothetical protein